MCLRTTGEAINCNIDSNLIHFCYIVVLAMYRHLTDVQWEHSTSTQGKTVSVTAR